VRKKKVDDVSRACQKIATVLSPSVAEPRSLYALVSHLYLTELPDVSMPYSDMWQDCQSTLQHTRPELSMGPFCVTRPNPTQPNPWVNPTHGQLCTRPCYAKSSYRSVNPQSLHGNVKQVDHVPNGPTNSAAITTMLALRLHEGKLLVAVTRERRYSPSRLGRVDEQSSSATQHRRRDS